MSALKAMVFPGPLPLMSHITPVPLEQTILGSRPIFSSSSKIRLLVFTSCSLASGWL